jgi:hypothetical protein
MVKYQTSLFVVLPKVIPNLKQVSSARIVILRHFKTRSRVFSNNCMDGATGAKYLDSQLFSHLNLEDKIHIQGGWNVTTQHHIAGDVDIEDVDDVHALHAEDHG